MSLPAYPLRFRPILKRAIWGGRRLSELRKPLGPESDFSESWEVVDHGQDQSTVVDGPLGGKTLEELVRSEADWLVGIEARQVSFPLLVKYLDCNRVLSVQVHPDDAYASTLDPPDSGKTEAWYIIDAAPDSLLYAGLQSGVDRVMLREAIAAGQTEQALHSFQPQPGDVVFIPAGTVHALGSGLFVAEIQQSSDTTFRLFDWNRVDPNGHARPLHVEQSLQVTDFERGPISPIRPNPLQTGWQQVVACDKFILDVLKSGTVTIGGDGKFHIVTVPRGRATLTTNDSRYDLQAGDTVLLPAAMGRCNLAIPADATDAIDTSTALAAHLPT